MFSLSTLMNKLEPKLGKVINKENFCFNCPYLETNFDPSKTLDFWGVRFPISAPLFEKPQIP